MLRSLKKMLALVMVLVLSSILLPNPALAFVSYQGQFTATRACEALSSIKKGTNPDNVTLTPGQIYQIAGKNKDNASHYLVEIAGVIPSKRWVASNCVGAVDSSGDRTDVGVSVVTVPTGDDYLLALSWQPAFCEGKPDKTECQILAANPERFEAKHFVLHGLWPQPKSNVYCNVSEGDITYDKQKFWAKLPAVEKELGPETWERLQAVMPGTQSNLHRHEWIKHGTCYPGSPEEYFVESMALLDAFNKSPVQALIASNIGKQVAIKEIDEALSDFGSDAGEKVEVKCSNSLLGELWVNLKGDITPTSFVTGLLTNSPKANSEEYTFCLIDDARD
jgi:ribonuclease T2